jgi:hypothetical protein
MISRALLSGSALRHDEIVTINISLVSPAICAMIVAKIVLAYCNEV